MRQSLTNALCLTAVVALAWGAGQLAAPAPDGAGALLGAGASVGTLLLGAWFAGRLVALFGLPKLSGYLLFGIAAGPSGLGLVTSPQREYLEIINTLAISLIAFTAGGEIRFSFLRRHARAIIGVSAVQVAAVFFTVAAGVYLLLPSLELAVFDGPRERLAIALIVAAVATASSPAILVALIAETGARGAFPKTALAIAVCKDLALVALFAVVMAFAAAALGETDAAGHSVVRSVSLELGGSVLAGAALGMVLAWCVKRVNEHLSLFVILTGFGIALFSEALHFEPLIVALVAGLLMENLWAHAGEDFFETVEDLSLPVYCIFFAVAGASIDLSEVTKVWSATLAILALRTTSVYAGTWLGAKASGVEPRTRAVLWTAFIPQAGVSLALVAIIKASLGEDRTATLVSALIIVIAVNELLGPLFLKKALSASQGSAEGRPVQVDQPAGQPAAPPRETPGNA